MKNIHILPTNKSSRLGLQLDWKEGYNLQLSEIEDDWTFNWQKQHIYITSNKMVEEGDWCIDENGIIHRATKYMNYNHCKNIILTTDIDLIAYDVQQISDEFLEWFVVKTNDSNKPIDIVEVKDNREISNEFIKLDTMVYEIIIPE